MDGDNDESEKKLLKEFCNVSRIITLKKETLRIDFILDQGQKNKHRIFFSRPFPYKNILVLMVFIF
jgi:hypothetical protein